MLDWPDVMTSPSRCALADPPRVTSPASTWSMSDQADSLAQTTCKSTTKVINSTITNSQIPNSSFAIQPTFVELKFDALFSKTFLTKSEISFNTALKDLTF